jgi:23S rRNA (guanosine2251-2'-O)-methyltransferase
MLIGMAYLTGFHAIEERIKADGKACVLLLAKAGPRAREIVDLALERGVRVDRVGTHDLDRIASDHRGIALQAPDADENGTVSSVEEFLAGIDKRNITAVVLDEITDPHNYGAILRSCDQFGVDLVITRNKRTAKHSDIIAKSSSGASAWVPVVQVANLIQALELLKEAGFWIYGADMAGNTAYKTKLRGRVCLILGSEGSGISRLLRENCDGLLAIPRKGRVDSLNVSVAAGVLLYEVMRQRDKASE